MCDPRLRAGQHPVNSMVEYAGTRTLDPATWTAHERDRLIAFVRILLDWEAAGPETHDITDQQKDQPTTDERDRGEDLHGHGDGGHDVEGERGALRPRLLERSGT